MGNSKRLDILNKKAAEKAPAFELPRSPDKIVRGDFNPQDDAVIDAQVSLSELKDTLEAAGLSLADFLKAELNLSGAVSEREIRTPYGTFKAVLKRFTFDELKETCVIDENNPRDPSERTPEALAPLTNEIKHGWQTSPAIAYVRGDKKVSISDGGCRFTVAIWSETGLDIEVLDREPSAEVLSWLAEQSDKKIKFSVFDKGRLFCALMADNKMSQAELCQTGRYAKEEVSRCVSFFNAPSEIIDLMPVKSLGVNNVDKFNSAITTIVSKNAVQSAVGECSAAIGKLGDAPAAEKITMAVCKAVIEFAKVAQRSKSQPVAPQPVVIYEHEKIKAVTTKPSKNKMRIELNNLSEETEKAINELISNYLKTAV